MATLFTGGSVFDGHRYLPGHDLLVEDGVVRAVGPAGGGVGSEQRLVEVVDLAGGLVAPGFTDAHVPPDPGRARDVCGAT